MLLALYKYVHYQATTQSYTLPLDNKETPILVYYHLFRFLTCNLDLLIECSLLAE